MTQTSRAAIQAEITADIADNTSADISPADFRGVLNDISDTYLSIPDDADPLADMLEALVEAKVRSVLAAWGVAMDGAKIVTYPAASETPADGSIAILVVPGGDTGVLELDSVPVASGLTNTLRTYGTDGAGAVVDRTPAEQAAHLLVEATEANSTLGVTSNNGVFVQRTPAEQAAVMLAEATEANATLGITTGGQGFVQRTPAEQLTVLQNGLAAVAVTGTGEFDIVVAADTKYIYITPVGGNMTIDDVTGLVAGQVINVFTKQDTSNRTLTLAGGTNCVLLDTNALDMVAGSGSRGRAVLIGDLAADGSSVVPSFRKWTGPV